MFEVDLALLSLGMIKKNLPKAIVFLLLFQSCIVSHKSFVATSFEPVTIKQKGDLEVSASIRPFKFYKFNATVAVKDGIAVRAGYSGFPDLNNIDLSLIFFKNFKKAGLFVAPSYNYQSNFIKRDYSFEFFGIGRSFQYKCAYNSPGLAFGSSLTTKKGNSHHLILKLSYNMVDRYSYYYSENTASGKDSGFYIKDQETLDHKINNFFSFEPSYSFLVSRPYRKMAVRYQVGFNFCQTVLIHKYHFDPKAYGGPSVQEGTNLHPTSFPINISVGFIFKHSFKKTPKEE